MMSKYAAILLTLPAWLVLLAGCPQKKNEVLEPQQVETANAVPTTAQCKEPVPWDIEPTQTQMPAPEPNENEPQDRANQPAKDEKAVVKPNDVDINDAEPDTARPDAAEPNQVQVVEPNNTQPAAEMKTAEVAEPNKIEVVRVQAAEPNAAEPNAAKPTMPEPNTAQSKAAKPSSATLFHNKCAGILRTFVKEDGMVDYTSLRRRRLELKELLSEFDNLDPNQYNGWSREDKIALWINAYNIQMLSIIAANYPIKSSPILRIIWGPYSIQHIKGIWTDHKLMVMDEEFTLAEIEKRLFTGQFGDPRIYLAIAYASLSGPPLRNEPYYGYKLNEQLDDQTRRFLKSGYCLRIDRDKKAVYLSALFQPAWRGKEFVAKFGTDKKFKDQVTETRAVLNFISKYIPDQDVSFLELENYSIEHLRYDWTVNDVSKGP